MEFLLQQTDIGIWGCCLFDCVISICQVAWRCIAVIISNKDGPFLLGIICRMLHGFFKGSILCYIFCQDCFKSRTLLRLCKIRLLCIRDELMDWKLACFNCIFGCNYIIRIRDREVMRYRVKIVSIDCALFCICIIARCQAFQYVGITICVCGQCPDHFIVIFAEDLIADIFIVRHITLCSAMRISILLFQL